MAPETAAPTKKKPAYVDEFVLREKMLSAKSEQEIEIYRLAMLGLWCERHSVAIEDAFSFVISRTPVAHISRFEQANDANPNRKKR